jgi:hypothetical protein
MDQLMSVADSPTPPGKKVTSKEQKETAKRMHDEHLQKELRKEF